MSENNQIQSNIIFKERLLGGYKYIKCPQCNHGFETEQPKQTRMPYCNQCNKIILDLTQKFCCWCGVKFKKEERQYMIKTYEDAYNEAIERIYKAIELAFQYGQIDGSHHKMWVIDQMIRVLLNNDEASYKDYVKCACDGEDGPNTYDWDEGVAP